MKDGRMFKKLTQGVPHTKKLIGEAIKNIEFRCKNKTSLDTAAISSGFRDLDRLTAGFRNGTLAIISGGPSMGKTAFVLSIIQYLAVEKKTPILFFR